MNERTYFCSCEKNNNKSLKINLPAKSRKYYDIVYYSGFVNVSFLFLQIDAVFRRSISELDVDQLEFNCVEVEINN